MGPGNLALSAALAPLLDAFAPGMDIYLPGTTAEVAALADALSAEPERLRGVHVRGCFVPGMNAFDYAGLHPEAQLTTFMLPAQMRESFRAGRINLIGRTYRGAADTLAAAEYDLAIAHVAPPGPDGLCSLGIASDFAPLVWPRARRRALIINPDMPVPPRALKLPLAEADIVVECAGPLVTMADSPAGEEAERIARRVAALIPDGAHLQTGIGGAPGAIWNFLTDHKELTLYSGMANDGLLTLAEAGALAPSGHVAGIAYGSRAFYDSLARTDLIDFRTVIDTHGFPQLSARPRLHAINGALEVDLFGQVNVEWQGGKLASGVGGGPDFMRGAAASPGGRSIIALPSTARKRSLSRIVARLSSPSTGIARSDSDTVVTEHGVAELRDKGIDARAEALIAIADPAFRDDLAESWRALRATF